MTGWPFWFTSGTMNLGNHASDGRNRIPGMRSHPRDPNVFASLGKRADFWSFKSLHFFVKLVCIERCKYKSFLQYLGEIHFEQSKESKLTRKSLTLLALRCIRWRRRHLLVEGVTGRSKCLSNGLINWAAKRTFIHCNLIEKHTYTKLVNCII